MLPSPPTTAIVVFRKRACSQRCRGAPYYANDPTGLYAGDLAFHHQVDQGRRWPAANVELDLYAGKRGQLTPDVSYDVGVLTYVYPSNGLSQRGGLRQRQYHRVVRPGRLRPRPMSSIRTQLPTCSASSTARTAAIWTLVPISMQATA